ncbi:GH92 family glycosyl hydrolase [Halocola ammonii]
MTTRYFLLFALLLAMGCGNTEKTKSSLDYADPFVGTGGHGHTFPGATVPFGMVQLSPDTRLEGWDGCSGYHYSDSVIYGFSHTHLQGTGVSDYGDVLLMPGTGKIHLNNGSKKGSANGYSSTFNKDSEKASPGFYSVHLDKSNVDVQLTSTTRTGIHHYQQKDGNPLNLVVDLKHRDQVKDASLKIVNRKEVEGYRVSSAWATDQRVYFVMQFSEPITDHIESTGHEGTFETDSVVSFPGQVCGLNFKTPELTVRVGISGTSIDGARRNLQEEATHWDFDKYRKDAEKLWLAELNKIEIQTDSEEKKKNFYTALYHSFVAPNVFSDVDGRYRGTDGKIYQDEEHTQYTVFSLWDTFRATHPLFTMVQRERTEDFIHSFLNMYEQGGQLPVWELAGNYTGCMIGYHSVPVILDAYRKGITNFDHELVLEAMVQAADSAHLGKKEFAEFGFIPADKEHESVSKTLEYAFDDWCIAQFAKEIGNVSVYNRFIKRAQGYQNLFDPETGFMRPRENGSFIEPFDPAEVNFHFTEANSYQYSWFVPQDLSGLMKLHGGKEKFNERLDQVFAANSELKGRQQPDITGLIGQYAHGNEPSHHMAYLYNYSGEPWKTQDLCDRILNELYSPTPDGLSGNEDCGQMSSWYVLSSIGFYPVNPAEDCYTFGSPQFDKVTINLENGKTFSIETFNKKENGSYINSITLNGEDHRKNYISDKIIQQGGDMSIRMTPMDHPDFGVEMTDRPQTKIDDQLISAVPFVKTSGSIFTEEKTIAFGCAEPDAKIYAKDVSTKDGFEEVTDENLTFSETTILELFSETDGQNQSNKIRAEFRKVNPNMTIKLRTQPDPQYSAEGAISLIDGKLGDEEFRTGKWLGFQGEDFEALIDLKETEKIQTIQIRFLQDIRPWIWLPVNVTVSLSNNGKDWEKVATLGHGVSPKNEDIEIYTFNLDLDRKARFVKLEAQSFGKIPEWHPGRENQSWLFVDEIIVE